MLNHDVTGVRPVDIHAHFFPQAYLDVLAEEGPRFNVEYRAAEEGFYIKTEVRFQGPLSYRIVDLKKRIADMDAQGTAVQAMSLTGPMAHWGDEEVSHKLARSWNDAASAAHIQYPTRLVGLLTLPMLFPHRSAGPSHFPASAAGGWRTAHRAVLSLESPELPFRHCYRRVPPYFRRRARPAPQASVQLAARRWCVADADGAHRPWFDRAAGNRKARVAAAS